MKKETKGTNGIDIVLGQIWKRRNKGNALYSCAVIIEADWQEKQNGEKTKHHVTLRSWDQNERRIPRGAQRSRITFENLHKNFIFTKKMVPVRSIR